MRKLLCTDHIKAADDAFSRENVLSGCLEAITFSYYFEFSLNILSCFTSIHWSLDNANILLHMILSGNHQPIHFLPPFWMLRCCHFLLAFCFRLFYFSIINVRHTFIFLIFTSIMVFTKGFILYLYTCILLAKYKAVYCFFDKH